MKFTKTVIAALAIGASSFAHADGIEWSGFGSLYYAQTFDQQILPTQFTNNKMDFTHFSSFGLNMSSKLSDSFTFYGQVVATEEAAQTTNFNLFAQWAFLNIKTSENSHLKIGRQLFPALMSSEYSRVHYLLSSNHIPLHVTATNPFISIDGASYNMDFNTGFGKFNFGIYTGSPKLNTSSTTVVPTYYNAYGLQANVEGSGWKVHATASKFKVSVDYSGVFAALGTGKKTVNNLYTLGTKFDNYNVLLEAEAILRTSSTAAILGNGKKNLERAYGGYATAGYRFGKFLPRFTYATSTTWLGFSQGKIETYGVGMNYAVNDQAVVKVDFEKTYIPSAGGGWYPVTQSSTAPKGKQANAVFAGVDFIF
ncbi:MAG: hypothetical protein K2Q18_00050 [Bdellovibrionales bacterium]|nr:hypothetical protein [Bdellovibrionales bacterium]